MYDKLIFSPINDKQVTPYIYKLIWLLNFGYSPISPRFPLIYLNLISVSSFSCSWVVFLATSISSCWQVDSWFSKSCCSRLHLSVRLLSSFSRLFKFILQQNHFTKINKNKNLKIEFNCNFYTNYLRKKLKPTTTLFFSEYTFPVL